ncbi:MAG: hypothetical protein II229_01135 [Clostridia bacterium]|nr:hypothetical protein [Clostridia bacterium]
MATTTIPWGDGSGDNIYLDYPAASGDQTVAVSSDANTGAARTKVVTFSASGVTPVTLTVEQAAGSLAPVFYEYLVGDGTAYIDTGLVMPENGSLAGLFGWETVRRGSQNIFGAFDVGGGETGVVFGGSTSNSNRQFVAYYDKSSYVGTKTLSFYYTNYGMFMTPKRFGYGNDAATYTKGSQHPAATVKIFGGYPTYTSFSGALKGAFTVYGSDAQNAANYAALIAFTPVATFRPCTYNGVAGLWYVEQNRFLGNAAASGAFTATNTI